MVRKVRQVNRCVTEGPLLVLAEAEGPNACRDVVAMDISRHVDDRQAEQAKRVFRRRFAIEFLRHDAAKWATSFKLLEMPSICHAPLIGVDKHWCYAMQILTAGQISQDKS